MSWVWHAYMEPNSFPCLPRIKQLAWWEPPLPDKTTYSIKSLFIYIIFCHFDFFLISLIILDDVWVSFERGTNGWKEKKKNFNHSDRSIGYKWLRPCRPPICPLSAAQLSWHALPARSNPNPPNQPTITTTACLTITAASLSSIIFIRSLCRRLIPGRRTQVDVRRRVGAGVRVQPRCDEEPPQEARVRAVIVLVTYTWSKHVRRRGMNATEQHRIATVPFSQFVTQLFRLFVCFLIFMIFNKVRLGFNCVCHRDFLTSKINWCVSGDLNWIQLSGRCQITGRLPRG